VIARRSLAVLAGLVLVLGAVPAADAAAAAPRKSSTAANEARIGGRGFGSRRPTFRTRRPTARRPTARRPAARRPVRRRPLFGWHGFFGGVLRALGIAYLLNLLFGWGPGGSPLGLLIVLAIVVWLATRSRRRRPVYW
jgi:hypothetical protein